MLLVRRAVTARSCRSWDACDAATDLRILSHQYLDDATTFHQIEHIMMSARSRGIWWYGYREYQDGGTYANSCFLFVSTSCRRASNNDIENYV